MAIKGHFTTLFLTLVLIVLCQCAPRSKSNKANLPQTVYDQKQSGDYNIQLHLKDFQIIALLGDDALGGDYDYNYDYSDFTVKPSGLSSTTQKPPLNLTSPSLNETVSVTTEAHVFYELQPIRPTKEPEVLLNDLNKPTPPKPNPSILLDTLKNQTKPNATTPSTNSGTIKVEILDAPNWGPNVEEHLLNLSKSNDTTKEVPTAYQVPQQFIEYGGSGLSIVPGEEMGQNQESLLAGELGHYRRCASGFARDKKGRCRRVRRPNGAVSPQLPFSISRLASNLASKFTPKAALGISDSSSKANL